MHRGGEKNLAEQEEKKSVRHYKVTGSNNKDMVKGTNHDAHMINMQIQEPYVLYKFKVRS